MTDSIPTVGALSDEPHDVLLDLLQEPAVSPELSFGEAEPGDPIQSIALSISESSSSLQVDWASGESFDLDHISLDDTVQALAGRVPGLTATDPSGVTRWDAQLVLQGSGGNDRFSVADRPFPEGGETALTTFLATAGSDRYLGSVELDRVDYAPLSADGLSGLYISDDPASLPLVAANLPPLLGEAFASDSLLVHKNPQEAGEPQVDVLRNIELISLGAGADHLELSHAHPSLVVDFGDGDDSAVLSSAGLEPDVGSFVHLESLEWRPLGADGEPIRDASGDPLSLAFDVHEALEDRTTQLLLDAYPPTTHPLDAVGWSLTPFALPGEPSGVLPDWIALQSEPPTLELVGDGRVVVYSEWSGDPSGPNRRWLEIHVQDRRPDGLGLIGLELNLQWNAAALDLQPAELQAGQIFNSTHLPLFQDTGTPTAEQDGREGLTGLAAAALPNARQGVALGRVSSTEPQTLFARLLFDVEDPGQLPDLQLDVSLAPAAGGVPVREEQLLVLDDRSPLVWSLLVSPDQPEVGSHAFTLTRGDGQALEQRHLALAIRNVNDAPQAIPAADLPLEALATSVLQGAEIDHDLASLFRDQDHAQLQLSLLESPPWLHLDAQTGRLIGTPANGDVGVHQITVQAQDAKGARAEQQVTITVWNVNDAPEAGVVIAPPDLLQDQSFTYRLPSGAFRDPDLLLNLGEQLHYELEAPSWLQIDAATGTLTGTPGPGDVGITPVVVRAIDASGAMAEQAVSITVANVNDAPFRSEALLAVLEDGLSFDNGSLHQLDLSAWFSDPDLGFDPEESLNLELALDDGTGRFIALDPEDESEPMAWLQWDAASSQLTMAPGASEIGEHYLRVVASDRAGRQAAALVPLAVRHPNSSPTVQWPPTEQELAAWRPQGVEQVLLLPDSSGLELHLAQEEQVLLQLPAQLFQDADLGIDPNEQLSLRIDGAETLFATQPGLPGLRFDPVNLTISGSTHGLGLEDAGGFSRWPAQLVATDRAGSSVSLALQLSLQRSAPEPVLTPLADPDQLWPEGTPIALAELLALELPDVEGQLLDVTIEQRQPLVHPLEWFALSGKVPARATQVAEDARPLWRIQGTAEQVQAQLAELRLHPAPGTALEDPIELLVSVQSELGNTGLRSQAVQQAIRFSIDPQATTPVWSTEQPEPGADPFSFTPFGTQLHASSSDPKEKISYRLNLPPDRADLVITDASGTALGVVDGDALVLSAAEWAAAVLRSRDGQLDPVALELQAQSREPSNNLTAASAPLTVQWAATPLLDQSAALALELPRELQRAGEISRLPLQLDWPPAARSAAIQIELTSGSSISLGGVLVQPEPPVEPGSARFVIQLQPDAAGELPGSVELEIRSPELFQGPLEGMATLLSSARASESTWSGEGWGADLDGALATASAAQAFQWDVVQMARLPEFPSEADANQAAINFDPATGALLIPIRRGATASGVRNPAEALTLAVSNIPAGYALAEKVGDAYQAVGATDVFGTLTLFTVPPAPADAADSELERFDPLNGGNLYLVALEENPPALAGVALQLNLTARVADQELADSRSGAVFHSLSLTDLLVTPPLLAVSPELVVPLILDLSGSGRVPLTALPADGGSISFAMLPGSAAMPTAWLAPEANADGLAQAAFVVLNDPGNDLDGDVTISSITELFSEYFQADGRQRSFASGSAALASLDSNADGLLNSADALWNRLQLWFDDGDARTQAGELRPLSETLQSIDLDSLTTLASQPDWVSGNAVLRSLNATASSDGNRLYPLYDVGLRVAPAGAAPLDLQVQGPLVLQEEGDAMALRLNSAGSESWLEDGRADLTLVRVSGLPAAVLPSLGVQDARGDWLFTWADLAAAGGTIQLIPGVDWSGSTNLQVLISQLQADGRLLSSALTGMALDVEAVADAPLLLLRAATTQEDTPLALQQLVQIAELRDRDGSETLQFELHDLPAGVQVVRSGGAAPAPLQAVDGVIRFSSAELPDLLLVPPAHQSGRLSFDWHALATEANGDAAITVARAQITVRAVADAPSAVAVAPVLPSLREGASVSLGSLILQAAAGDGLIDADGSELLRLEITMPDAMRVSHTAEPAWMPLSIVSGNGLRTVVVSAADVGQLQLVDRGLGPVDGVNLTITRISRELSNGEQARSAATGLQLPVARNARPATLTRLTPTGLVEDGAPVALSSLVQVQPAHAGDNISYRLEGLSSGLTLVDAQGQIQTPLPGQNHLALSSLEGYALQPTADRAGSFALDLQVISTPPGGGDAATTTQRLSFSVAAVADRPSLQLASLPQQPMELELNGWLDLAGLAPALSSGDRDGSEQLALIIGANDADGQPQALPPQARFNVPASQLDDGRWLIPQARLADLRLYLGEIGEDLALVLTPRASEGSSRQEGDPVTLTVAANAVVRVPLLEVSGELQGLEDQLIPLFGQLGGVIAATHRGYGAGQTLELEISGLPEGASLVQLQAGGPPIPLNRTAGGASITSLRLPYSQWQGVHWQGPADQSGPMSFQVQAFSVGRTGVVKATQISTVQVRLTAVNDAPRLVDAADLEVVQEGSLGHWDLRSRFTDLDNADADLRITAVQETAEGEQPLPAWLSLGSDGVLRGTPGNADVGSLQLKVTATDPLGEALTAAFHLAVGDLNAAPQLDLSAPTSYTLDLRETQQIQLTGPEAAFSDEDSIHGDQLSFTISQDGQAWSTEVQDLASIADGVLTIRPNAKWTVGEQQLQLRATDRSGASVIQQLQLQVNNVNDPPLVSRPGAELISDGLWREIVQVQEGDPNWQLNLQGLFTDADQADALIIETPTDFPAWLNLSAEGVLSGMPGNTDVGVVELEWQASDPVAARATYRLELEVLNLNQAPEVLKPAPGFTLEAKEESYSRLDLSTLFSDVDNIHGDRLRYSVQVVREGSEAAEEAPEWLGVVYRQPEPPDASGKLLVQPVFYRVDAEGMQGERVAAEELQELAIDTLLRVVIEAMDDRSVDKPGLVGVDLDLSWSPSIELVADSTVISTELPLFNDVLVRGAGLRVQAGSAPDGLGIGGSVGDGDAQAEALLQFDVRLKDPKQTVLINVSPGQGVNRDGLLDRTGQQLTADNSVIHSFASEAGADLQILAPANEAVGSYTLTITAADQGGATVSAELPLHIANTNDAPVLLKAAQDQLQNLLTDPLLERTTAQISSLRLFTDQDLIHDGVDGDALLVGLVSESGDDLENIALQSDANGNITLTLAPSRGLTQVLEQTFRLEATDREGKNIATDWFTAVFRPMAELALLTTGSGGNMRSLKGVETGFQVSKNVGIDLQSVLALNAIEVADPEGDDVVLKIRIAESGANLTLTGGVDGDENAQAFTTKSTWSDNDISGVTFSVNLEKLQESSGKPLGSLEGLQLELPPNKFELLPLESGNAPILGVGVDIWTEASVRADDGNGFAPVVSEISRAWIEIVNSAPFVTMPGLVELNDESFLGSGQVLYSLSTIFKDPDPGDVLSWSVEVPRALSRLVEIDQSGTEIRLSKKVSNFSDLPSGLHRFVVTAKDSSGLAGDRSGFVSAVVKLLIAAPQQDMSSSVNGLNLLLLKEVSDIESMFKKPPEELDADDKAVADLMSRLGVSSESEASAFAKKLSEGSLAIMQGASLGEFVMDASLGNAVISGEKALNADSGLLLQAKQLIGGSGDVVAPLGQLAFDLSTQGKDFAVVQIQLPDGAEVESLIKTTYEGNPYVFNSTDLKYMPVDGIGIDDDEAFELWLQDLPYQLYGYGPSGGSLGSLPALQSTDGSLSSKLPIGFDMEGLNMIDGSAYRIDRDGDGTVDLISMLFVDEGWFDTRPDEIGVIGDPLIPVKLVAPAQPSLPRASFVSESTVAGEPQPKESEVLPESTVAGESEFPEPAAVPESTVAGESEFPEPAAVPESAVPDEVDSSSVLPVDNGFSPPEQVGYTSRGISLTPQVLFGSVPIASGLSEATSNVLGLIGSQAIGGSSGGRNVLPAHSEPPTQDMADQSLPGELPRVGRALAGFNDWLQARQREATDWLHSLIEPILDQPGEASMTAVLAMLVGPVMTERVGTRITRSIRQSPKLRLTRRDPNFQGRWLMPSRDGRLLLIERNRHGLMLDAAQPGLDDHSALTLLPGFDLQGRSLLSQALPLCRQPGLLMQTLLHLNHELQHSADPDIHWQVWLDTHFEPAGAGTEALAALDGLQALLQRALQQDPALADVVMLSQLQDCCDQLGLSGLRSQRRPRTWPHQDAPTLRDAAP